ncbi:pentapeptide repeat-containing protein [Nocardia rhizosphaerihabitans]|uniref:WD40 domain-containing protein n=1 Tax=Nocardia rhizosphaerihabitans TaxID=1691570 RepID=UPI003673606E
MRIEPTIAITRLRELDGWEADDNLRRAVRLGEHMGDRDEVGVAEALDVLHPGGTMAAKTATLQRVVDAVRDGAADVELVIAPDHGPVDRRVSFTAEHVAASEARLVELGTVGEKFVERQSATVRRDGKPVVRIFLSYSADDAKAAAELWKLLGEHAAIDNKYHFEFWDFKQSLLPGDEWHKRTTDAIEAGDLGIFAVSRHFLASSYIHQYELPNFVKRHAAIPVLLESLDLTKVDRKGLDGLQIFRPEQRAFDSVRGNKRNLWVQQLRNNIRELLERQIDTDDARTAVPEECAAPVEEEPGERARTSDLDAAKPYLTHTFGQSGKLSRTPDLSTPSSGSRVNAVDHLVHWAGSASAPLAAVLGEYGVGKTITCQALMRELQRRRRNGEADLPEPLYFDLRNLSGLRSRAVPTLTEILDECVQRGWSTGESGRPTAQALLDRAKTRPTLFIVDGLDEALVHLNSSDGTIFTKELLSLRPSRAGHFVAGRDTKVLLSCRTHYFRTVAEQYGQFTGQHRDVADAEDFEALLLLPFTDDQILHYLSRAVPDHDSGQVFDMLASLHDLSDLTSRPVTLKLVAQQVSFIEQRRAQGLPVHAADIYLRVVTDWLERDKGKEQFRAQDKLTLTARLAAWMWKRNERTVDLTRIEVWLHDQVQDDPAMRRYKGVQAELLEEDLRTATFLVRQDSDDGSSTEGFRFAHTSFQEFFVAQYLLTAIEDDRPEDWAIRPSSETLDFLGQLLQGHRRQQELIAALGSWRHIYRPITSELLIQYAMYATECGWRSPILTGIDLTGADLRGFQLSGSATALLDLSGARLGRADLSDAILDFVDLSGADLASTRWERAVLHRCTLTEADCSDAYLAHAFVHECELFATQLDGANMTGLRHVNSGSGLPDPPRAFRTALAGLGGHTSTVSAAAWSSDNTRVVTGSSDNARIWDANTGEPLLTLADHAGSVTSVAWSPDDTRVLTGSDDHTARIWNADTGELLLTLTDNTAPVIAVAWSPDNTRILVSSYRFRVCDAVTGETLVTPTDLVVGRVSAVAWSLDNTRIITGSVDSTARIWNAHTGRALLALIGHAETVTSVAWSPDNTRVLTGSKDCTARIWNAHTGETLLTLANYHSPVNSVAWSPDGTHVLAGCHNGTTQVSSAITGETLRILASRLSQVHAVAWARTRILIGGFGGSRICDGDTGEMLFILTRRTSWANAVAWAPDNTRTLTGGIGHTRICDGDTGETLLTLTGRRSSATTLAWSSDSTRVITGAYDHSAQIWDASDGGHRLSLFGHTDSVSSIAWSPDNTRVLTGSRDHSARIWNAVTGETLLTLTAHGNRVNSVAWSRDGTRIITGSDDNTARIWNTETGETLLVFADRNNPVKSVAWSSDNTRVFVGRFANNQIRDAQTGELLLTLDSDTSVRSVAWSPDSIRIATASLDNFAQIWDARTGDALLTLTGHTGWVNSVSWSPDNARVVTGSDDGTTRVWDALGTPLFQSQAFSGSESASWAPQENRLLSVTPDAWRFLRAATFDADGKMLGLQPYERYYAVQPMPPGIRGTE